MDLAIQIPIKGKQSTRVPNKNFRELGGKPLSWWLLDRLVEAAPANWDLFIDSESEAVWDKLKGRYGKRLQFFRRDAWFASDEANGNHLIHQFGVRRPEYDIYAQAYVTAVTLPGEVVVEAINALASQLDRYDSLALVTEETGWFWYRGQPVNYQPDKPGGLPRSQDASLVQETTGLYAITREALFRTGCRVGMRPLFYKVPRAYAFDVDTMEDFREAQRTLVAEPADAEVDE